MDVKIDRVPVEEVLDLRWRVLRAGLPRETARSAGDERPDSVHFAARSDGIVVGCATLHLNQWEGTPAYRLRGVATEEEARGRGVGKKLMASIEAFVRLGPVRILWCNARVPAVGFYQKHGWETVSPEFDIPTAGPHVKMLRILHSP